MSTTKKAVSKHVDVNAEILSSLDGLNTMHMAKKTEYFARGLPFYTCIDAALNLYTKETKDGRVTQVVCRFDFAKDGLQTRRNRSG